MIKLSPLDPWIRQKIGSNQPALTRQEINAWQLNKLNENLSLARKKTKFYRNHFKGLPESINDLEEFCQFPFTTPQDVRASPLQFVCVSQDEIQRVVTLQSSGTTGEPKRIFFTESDQDLTIDFFGVGMSTLTEPGDRVLILLPGETPGSVGDLLRLGLERVGRIPIPYGAVRNSLQALQMLNTKKADCLVGSPSQVLGLARRWQPGMYKPRSVLLSTDYVPAAIIKILNETWDCQVYNHYGATEMGLGGGVECSAHRGCHLREADLFFEIINPKTGAPVPDGEYGEDVFSTLTRSGMPLIRYRIGDRSRFIRGDCPCGTTLKNLESVSGRFDDFIQVRNKVLRLPDFDEALFSIPDLLNFSVVVKGTSGKEILSIYAQMLTSEDPSKLFMRALKTIPAANDLQVTLHCLCNPEEPGSLSKRTILDERGNDARSTS